MGKKGIGSVLGLAAAVAGFAVSGGMLAAGYSMFASSLVGAVVSSGLSFATSALLGSGIDQPEIDMGGGFEAGILENRQASDDPIPVVYGSRRMGGTRVFIRSSGGNKNDYLHIITAHCVGPVSAINTVYIDGVDSGDSKFSGLVTVHKHLGAEDQVANASLVAEISEWTDSHQLRGVCYTYLRLKYDSKAFSRIPAITADIDGRTVFDPRDSSTSFSANPALCIRDYLTDTRYGWAIPGGAMDDVDTFTAEANYFDQLTTIGGESIARYRMGGALSVDKTRLENLKDLLTSCRGIVTFEGGVYKLKSDRPATPVAFTLTQDNIIGPMSLTPGGKANTFNRVRSKFFNPERDWQDDYAIWDSPTRRTEDNELLLQRDNELPFTPHAARAEMISTLNGQQSRQMIELEISTKGEALELEVFDVVPLTHASFGFVDKLFRVVDMGIGERGEVSLQLREYDASVYNFGTIDARAETPDTNLPDPFDVSAPTSLSLTSGTDALYLRGDGTVMSRIRASWVEPADIFVLSGGKIEIEFKKDADSEWQGAGEVRGDMTVAWVFDAQDGEVYSVRIRSRNGTGITSAWLTVTGHVVVGKTEPPSNPTGYSVQQNGDQATHRWNRNNDPDHSGSEIRYTLQGAWDWDSATVLTAVTKGTLITNAGLPPGSWTCGLKHVDTSGNYSDSEVEFNVTISSTNDVVISDAEHPLWPGILTNMVVHELTSALVPTSQGVANDDGWDTFDQFVPNPFATCSYEGTQEDLGFDSTVRVWAEITAGLGPGESGSADPALFLDSRLDAGSYDGFEPWSVGEITARFVKSKVTLTSAGGVGFLTALTTKVDVDEHTESGTNQPVAVGGTSFGFAQQFNVTPNISITPLGSTALVPSITAQSTTSFTVKLFDSGGADVGGNINWNAFG